MASLLPHPSAVPKTATPVPVLSLSTAVGPALVESAEQEIGLPAGAWRRRRLFALRVGPPGLGELGIHRGDLLIVEPGQQANCDHLVIVRKGTSLLLRRVIGQGRRQPSVLIPPEPGTLPFPLPARSPDVVGTVIGVLAKSLSAPGRSPIPGSAATASAAVLRALNAQRLDANLKQWWDWLGPLPLPTTLTPRQSRYRQMLGERLRLLSSCMAVASNRRLHGALLSEANRVITAMQREATSNDGPTLVPLLQIPRAAIAAARHRKPPNPQYAHTAGCGSA